MENITKETISIYTLYVHLYSVSDASDTFQDNSILELTRILKTEPLLTLIKNEESVSNVFKKINSHLTKRIVISGIDKINNNDGQEEDIYIAIRSNILGLLRMFTSTDSKDTIETLDDLFKSNRKSSSNGIIFAPSGKGKSYSKNWMDIVFDLQEELQKKYGDNWEDIIVEKTDLKKASLARMFECKFPMDIKVLFKILEANNLALKIFDKTVIENFPIIDFSDNYGKEKAKILRDNLGNQFKGSSRTIEDDSLILSIVLVCDNDTKIVQDILKISKELYYLNTEVYYYREKVSIILKGTVVQISELAMYCGMNSYHTVKFSKTINTNN